MLTRNFWKVFAPLVGRIQGEYTEVSLKLISGNNFTATVYQTSSMPYSLLGAVCAPWNNAEIGNWFGTWYGTGTTPATIDDYKLEKPITDTSITGRSGSKALVISLDADGVRFSAPHSLTNTTSNDIVVSEIGCFGQMDSSKSAFLLDRTVLETPVVVPAGKTVAMEYVIKFPYGT
jgi:hypothetical protein